MTSEHVAELLLPDELNARMDRHGIMVWCLLFAILFDPEPDGHFKHYIQTLDTIIFSDGEWIASYRLLDNGDVLVSNLVQDTHP